MVTFYPGEAFGDALNQKLFNNAIVKKRCCQSDNETRDALVLSKVDLTIQNRYQ